MNELKILIERFEDFSKRSVETAKLLDAGDYKNQPATLSFNSMQTLLKVLTPNRWTLVEKLSEIGPSSIRLLAQQLKRDYRGVHADVKALEDEGLIILHSGKISVPWCKITAVFEIGGIAA
ncbi:hypothetical protein [Phyllobacterium sp. OV277]|uniref:HVO_A0114 family putative DNA-binding protein n=1 Tax=Phyllobacterium sp. OV277 TaxID=1882772 RepID=UPI0008879636|nr:hypothetical protein [Phyllobacterium sp. OV277]SDO43577.1 Predicted transcriptional regulator [Phyllobacterium sp. OV277]